MLVLTRRLGEALVIADRVTVTVLAINGNRISVGIEAPRNISVNREEIQRRKYIGACKGETGPKNDLEA